MSGLTNPYGLTTLGYGEALSVNGGRFIREDRQFIARALWLGAEGHHHTGDAAEADPTAGPGLALATGGTLPPGRTVEYRWSLVDPNGFESKASPPESVVTPAAIAAPGQPVSTVVPGSGTLPPGNYAYVVTVYVTTTNQETTPSDPIFVTIPPGSATNEITLDMPTLPPGGTGFNIYRRKPGGTSYLWMAATTGSSWTDDGSVDEDCDRRAPSTNTTNQTSQVTVTPGTVPAGWRWRLYARFDANDWLNTLIADLDPGTTSFVDTGASPGVTGTPLEFSQLVGSPPMVDPNTEVDWSAGFVNLGDAMTFQGGAGGGFVFGDDPGTSKLGFFGALPVNRPGAYTQTYNVSDKVLDAYTPDDESTPYTGATDGEAQLADLNALRTAVENLRLFTEDAVAVLNSVVDDLQQLGLVG